MAVSQPFIDFLSDMLAPLGVIAARRMFGGASLYADGVLFALIDDDVLYLKADATSAAKFEAEGLRQFTYDGQTGPVSMAYWRAPERVFDDPDEMLEWAREAVAAARRAAKPKPGAAARPKRPRTQR